MPGIPYAWCHTALLTGVGTRCKPVRGAALTYKACYLDSMWGLALPRRVWRP